MTYSKLSFTHVTWQHWLAHIRAFALAPVTGARARALFASVILLELALNTLNVLNSYVGRNFMTAIAARDEHGFLTQAGYWVAVFAVITGVTVMARYYEDRLGLRWREWATRQLLERYMYRRNYLQVAIASAIENPDQRIAEDVKSFTTVTLSFVLMIFNGSLTVVAFAAVLWTISPTLFGVGVIYASIGTALSLLLGRRLVRLNYQQLDREADFRAALVHVKENAPLVALAHREPLFAQRLGRRLGNLIDNASHIVVVQRNLGFFTTGYNWLIQLIPALIVAPLFMHGQVEFGVITQATMAFTHLLGAFSLIVMQIQLLSSLAAVVARLDALHIAVDDDHASPRVQPATAGIVTTIDDGRLTYTDVTVLSAHGRRLLVAHLDLEVRPGLRLLVRGADNDVRAMLLRTTAGLRNFGSGHITRPTLEQIMFVTEQPYLPVGSLLDLLLENSDSDHDAGERHARVLDLLHTLGLEAVLARCIDVDTEHDWNFLLTLGEQQLLVCARVLLSAPRFVVLERLSVTLEPAQIARLFALLSARGITYIVFEAQYDDLAPFDAVLDLAAEGAWTLRRLQTAVAR